MANRSFAPTLAAPLGTRFLEALLRYFNRSVVSREAIDQSWIDSGLGRLDAHTLRDIGAPAAVIERERLREAWKLAAALDAVRHL
jgi:hypothetical protein